ncbi:PREDICTED: uncharacterized protein LOC100642006 [Amphimedon queenslandica]|uniref:Sperm microtubule inner protein 1 C-terminal domain-containing protein n=1 Tax=Amphimedon queenslandica TaxID=400682 RepID=A0A1X7VAV5_AMPQE|nr:PREDICTED: uncharacterized protein LOC100642006 [Amphimedon queenslandica]|eukprot:XP_003384980.1 PREDICTED: uncharacterized protein LOC100642006 [Amphimedon queenslandica]
MPVTMDTQQQNFWLENIQKEAAIRFAWQLRYSKTFGRAVAGSPQQQKDKKKEQEKKKKKEPVSGGIRSNLSAQIHRLQEDDDKESLLDAAAKGFGSPTSNKQSLPIRDMRPPSVNTKKLLYNGISAHGEGRYAYLKRRSNLPPEMKYEYPVLSSNLHGWKIIEYAKEPQRSPYGRTCIIRDTFYRNSGITLT